jgi:hemolysin activation/secretion protein
MLTTDNFGSRYTGRERTMAYLAWSNPFHAGDVASLNLLSSGSLLNYQQLGYEIPVLSPGAALGLATTHMQYRLGNGAEALMAHGLLTQMGYWFQYSLDADSQTKTDLRLQYEESAMSDRQDSTDSKNDRHINKWSVSLNWDASSAWWGHAGSTQFNTSVSFGQLFFDDPVSLANDAATAQSSGPFAKWNTRASRSQSLNDAWSLAFSLDMQLANHNLDSTQKMSVGGFHSVRAFESGVLSADEAVFASVECRVHLPPPPANLHVSGEWYGAIFWDAAATRINKKTWSADSNQATLLGSGIGLYWQGKDNWRSSLAVANMQGRLPDALTASGVAMHSVWFELSKGWR